MEIDYKEDENGVQGASARERRPAKLAVVILTQDEERHIARCIDSVLPFADLIIVVDSGSADRTTEIALSKGAEVYFNPWTNYSTQMNWGIDQARGSADFFRQISVVYTLKLLHPF